MSSLFQGKIFFTCKKSSFWLLSPSNDLKNKRESAYRGAGSGTDPKSWTAVRLASLLLAEAHGVQACIHTGSSRRKENHDALHIGMDFDKKLFFLAVSKVISYFCLCITCALLSG